MDEILRNLKLGARVLDIGAYHGSFPLEACPGCMVVRVDLHAPPAGIYPGFVRADAARLPFRDASFDAIISNHSLEHIDQLKPAIQEIGRVVRKDGSLFVAVPDASTFTDRLFRWIYQEESGHINHFRSANEIADRLSRATRLRLVAQRDLYSNFDFLIHYPHRGKSWRHWLAGNGSRRVTILLSYFTRILDRIFHTRASIYGWAQYFGNIGERVRENAASNVCVGCGAGMPATWLMQRGLVRSGFLILRVYRCPHCNSRNLFTLD